MTEEQDSMLSRALARLFPMREMKRHIDQHMRPNAMSQPFGRAPVPLATVESITPRALHPSLPPTATYGDAVLLNDHSLAQSLAITLDPTGWMKVNAIVDSATSELCGGRVIVGNHDGGFKAFDFEFDSNESLNYGHNSEPVAPEAAAAITAAVKESHLLTLSSAARDLGTER